MRILMLLTLALGGCGPHFSKLPAAEQEAVCKPLLQQIGDRFGCTTGQILMGLHATDVNHKYTATLHFAPDGRLDRFTELRPHENNRQQQAPGCVSRALQSLNIEPRPKGISIPVRLHYRARTPPNAEAYDDRCVLTLPPVS